MSGLGDRTLDLGGRQPIRRGEGTRTIDVAPVERVDRTIEPREPIVRDEPGRGVVDDVEVEPPVFPNPSLPINSPWTGTTIGLPPQTEPGADIAPDDASGFYLGDFFIPYWLPLAAVGLWLFLKK